MREVGRVEGWLSFEFDGRYYVRAEEVVAWLSNSGTARVMLAAILRDDLEPPIDDAAV